MTVIALVPVLICIIGALVFALTANGTTKELGRIAYAVGLLWTVYSLAGHVVRL